MQSTYSAHARHFQKRRQRGRQRVNLYPLLGILLVALAAVLGYGALYLLFSA